MWDLDNPDDMALLRREMLAFPKERALAVMSDLLDTPGARLHTYALGVLDSFLAFCSRHPTMGHLAARQSHATERVWHFLVDHTIPLDATLPIEPLSPPEESAKVHQKTLERLVAAAERHGWTDPRTASDFFTP